jgi:hypothetical protein
MPGLVPGIHVLLRGISKTWMAGTSPAMTALSASQPYFIAPISRKQRVGWVERSETHRISRLCPMGFASLYPSNCCHRNPGPRPHLVKAARDERLWPFDKGYHTQI